MREILREVEVKLFPEECLGRLKREFTLKGWKVVLDRYKEDKKSGRLTIKEKVDEAEVWEEVERFYKEEGYEVKLEKVGVGRMVMKKGEERYWAVVIGTARKTDVYVYKALGVYTDEVTKKGRLVLKGVG